MFPAESFRTFRLNALGEASSLRSDPRGEAITRILAAAIQAVDPAAAVRRFIRREGDRLTVAGRDYNLGGFRSVVLLGIGKASLAMSEALVEVLDAQLNSGLVITKHAVPLPHSPLTVLEGGHPIPDERSLFGGVQALHLLSTLGADDLIFCLVSGGGSALAVAPVEGVTLADMQALTAALLTCGARIDEINALRRRLDRLKGGGMARETNRATIVSLILSDVVGSLLEAIASGPTAPDPISRLDALAILTKYKLKGRIPSSINHALRFSSETPKPGDLLFDKVQNVIVGSNLLAAQAALRQAEEEGFHPYLLRTDLQGEARQAAFELATFLRQTRQTGDPVPAPACIVAGGETTVTVKGNGMGGRNTELALAAVSELAGFPGVMVVTLATDGEDGATDSAGAVVTGDSFRRAVELGLQPEDFLERNDSYSFFSTLGDLLKPGPTGTNVNDLVFLFTF